MKSKRWYSSKTVWFNVLVLMLAMAEEKLQLLSGVLPGGLYAWLAFGLPVINVALRRISTVAITFLAAKEQT